MDIVLSAKDLQTYAVCYKQFDWSSVHYLDMLYIVDNYSALFIWPYLPA